MTSSIPVVASDENPTVDATQMGPAFASTHPLATGPVVKPMPTVDVFVAEFLDNLNFGQGVLLSRSTVVEQYQALAKTVQRYLMAAWRKPRHSMLCYPRDLGSRVSGVTRGMDRGWNAPW